MPKRSWWKETKDDEETLRMQCVITDIQSIEEAQLPQRNSASATNVFLGYNRSHYSLNRERRSCWL